MVLVETDRHGARRVAQVPEDHRTGVVGGRGDAGQVEQLAGPVVDVGQDDDRDVRAELGGISAGGGVLDPPAELARDPATTYWSVGKDPGSVSTTDRPGRRAAAACSDWCRRTLVESPTTT